MLEGKYKHIKKIGKDINGRLVVICPKEGIDCMTGKLNIEENGFLENKINGGFNEKEQKKNEKEFNV